jgi:mitogen-activated protein kinase 1/3
MKNLVRELSILRQLTKMKNNVFTIKLHSVILPERHAKFDDIDKLDHIFIVTDYMETDIQKLVQVTQPDNFDQSHSIAIIYNFLCAINFLHSANIMHRDLKSENVLIDDECRIKICDFGMARTMITESMSKDYDNEQIMSNQKAGRDDSMECLSRNVCTKWYRAPELVLLQDNYDSKVDMWGFGCILAELSYLSNPNQIDNRDKILFIGQKEHTKTLECDARPTLSTEDDFNLESIDN